MMKMFIKIVVSMWEALKNLSGFDVEFTCTCTSAKNFLLDSLLKLKTIV